MGPPGVVLQEELESVQKRAARFVTGNYKYETGSNWHSWTVKMSLVTRKPAFGVCDQVRHKPACAATEAR